MLGPLFPETSEAVFDALAAPVPSEDESDKRTTMKELAARTGVAVTGHGSMLSISALLQMASDAHVIPVICNDAGGILAYGRKRRLASPGQRLALAARDRSAGTWS